MLLRTLYHDRLAAATYLVGCQRAREAIVIDPQRDIDRVRALAAREGVRIAAIAETHIHADFLSGARELAEATGATVHVSGEGGAEWSSRWLDQRRGGGAYPHRRLRDGDLIQVGEVELRAVHTPGHTPEHLSFLVTDRGGGADAPMGLLSGDFIFVGDVGRPDLLESAVGAAGTSEPAARQLHRSVGAFAQLPEWLQVWPAHGAGSACGKALGAVPQSTVGYERRFNPALRAAADEEGFVRWVLAGQPEPPAYFARMKRLNRDGPPLIGAMPRPRELAPGELATLDSATTALVDLRPWNAFRTGHLRGSLFVPLTNSFPTEAGSMVAESEQVVLVAEPAQVEEAVRELVRVGIDEVVGWAPPAAIAAARELGADVVDLGEIDAAAARRLVDAGEVFVLDVRRPEEFVAGHIEGATRIGYTQLATRVEDVPGDRPVLVHCQGGGRSARAASLLARAGRTVMNLAGGFGEWRKREEGVRG